MNKFQDNFDLEKYSARLQLSPSTRTILEHIIVSPPARRPQGNRGNVTASYPSFKMQCTIRGESRNLEFAGIELYEHDNTVLGYFDQPYVVKLKSLAPDGKKVIVYLYTPDFLVIYYDRLVFVEYKTERELRELSTKNPNRYCQDETGKWHYIPAEEAFRELGFEFQLVTDKDIDYIFVSNIQYIEDFYRETCPPIPDEIAQPILQVVKESQGVTLFSLITVHEFSADVIYTMIARNQLYVDLSRCRLSDHTKVLVFSDSDTSLAFGWVSTTYDPNRPDNPAYILLRNDEPIEWDGNLYKIVNAGETEITLLSSESRMATLSPSAFEELVKSGKIKGAHIGSPITIADEAMKILRSASPEQTKIANHRYLAIQHLVSEIQIPKMEMGIPKRTLRHWVQKYRQAQAAWNCGYVGLIPQARSGNPQGRLPDEVVTVIREFIQEHYAEPRRAKKSSVLSELNQHLKMLEYPTISPKKFNRELASFRQHEEIDVPRLGETAAYKSEPPFLELELTTPRHGERSFHIGHIDHTDFDQELNSSSTGRNLGRSYATLLHDAYDRRLLATYVSFNPPSYVSDMMVLRECIRRHGRLPSIIVTDGGPDFNSIYYETMLAILHVVKFTRPRKKPRSGSVLERLYGTTNTEFIDNLLGNTQITKTPREITPETDPKVLTPWNLPLFYERLCRWGYTVYNKRAHPALGKCPDDAYLEGRKFQGERKHIFLPFNADLFFLTLPEVEGRGGMRELALGKGIKIHNFYYNCSEFFNTDLIGHKLYVRRDPWNIGVAYAYHHGRWIQCFSEHYAKLKNRSEKELEIASNELRQQMKKHNQNKPISASMLGDFLMETHDIEKILIQQLKDLDNRIIVEMISKSFGLAQYGYIENASAVPTLNNQPEQAVSIPETPPASLSSQPVSYTTTYLPDY